MECPHCGVSIDEHEASRCLDAWVAEAVMGRVVKPWDDDDHRYFFFDDHDQRIVWEYSTDMAAAWKAVERVGQDNFTHLIWYNAEGRSPYFIAAFGFGKKVKAKADAMPLAICRAALKTAHETQTA